PQTLRRMTPKRVTNSARQWVASKGRRAPPAGFGPRTRLRGIFGGLAGILGGELALRDGKSFCRAGCDQPQAPHAGKVGAMVKRAAWSLVLSQARHPVAAEHPAFEGVAELAARSDPDPDAIGGPLDVGVEFNPVVQDFEVGDGNGPLVRAHAAETGPCSVV